MNLSAKHWRSLFLFCLGIFIASAFCMKWMEADFISRGKPFTMIGLEFSYDQAGLFSILSGLDEPVRQILRYHLVFDFVFMAGVFPGIAALCRMALARVNHPAMKKTLSVAAWLQLPAWGCDIYENSRLLQWTSDPATIGQTDFYHLVVWTKWILAVSGVLVAVLVLLRPRRKRDTPS